MRKTPTHLHSRLFRGERGKGAISEGETTNKYNNPEKEKHLI